MNDLSAGTVIFLFTDIEGSAKLAQQYPNAKHSFWRSILSSVLDDKGNKMVHQMEKIVILAIAELMVLKPF